MSVAFKPDVSTLQIVEVDVSTSQKMGKPSRVIRSYSAEQIPVTRGMHGLSQKLGVLRQPGKPSRINASCVAKVWCESPFSRYTFATSFFEFQLHPPNAPLTSTLKSDNYQISEFFHCPLNLRLLDINRGGVVILSPISFIPGLISWRRSFSIGQHKFDV